VPRKVLLAVASLYPGNGGIARVARLMRGVLSDMAVAEGLDYRIQVLSDQVNDPPMVAPARVDTWSRLRFVGGVQRAVLDCSHFIYDFVGMARAHPHIPFCRLPMMTWLHGIDVWENTPSHRIRTARMASLLVANTNYTLSRANRVHNSFINAKVCWLATESDRRPTKPRQIGGPPTVLVVGRMDETRYKGHSAIIRCWPEVVAAVPDARLTIVGMGPGREQLVQEAACSSAHQSIKLLGFIPDEEIESEWSRATVFAMPSRGEGFGLVYIEAMRHAIPVIASVHDAGSEINLHGVTGFNIDLDRAGELTERIVELLRNQDLAATLGREGQNRWEVHFRYSAFQSRFRSIVSEFLSM
jgi:phosphatidyl-myo-inositol dimannoside synthase